MKANILYAGTIKCPQEFEKGASTDFSDLCRRICTREVEVFVSSRYVLNKKEHVTGHSPEWLRVARLPESWDSKIRSWVPRDPNQKWLCWRGPAAIYHTRPYPEP
jgi:hypothetical protein